MPSTDGFQTPLIVGYQKHFFFVNVELPGEFILASNSLFSLVTFCASLRSSPLYLLLRTTSWKAVEKLSEIIRSLAVVFFCVLLFSSLPYLAFAVRIFAVVCCSLVFSQCGWTSLVLPFSSAPQPFPSGCPRSLQQEKVRWHSETPRVKSWAHWTWWQNSHWLQRGQGFTL